MVAAQFKEKGQQPLTDSQWEANYDLLTWYGWKVVWRRVTEAIKMQKLKEEECGSAA